MRCNFCGAEFDTRLSMDQHKLLSFSLGCDKALDAENQQSQATKDEYHAVEALKEGEEKVLTDGRVMKRHQGYLKCVAIVKNGLRQEL